MDESTNEPHPITQAIRLWLVFPEETTVARIAEKPTLRAQDRRIEKKKAERTRKNARNKDFLR